MHPGRLLLPGSLVCLAWLPLACPTICTEKPGTCPDLQSDGKVYERYCSQDASCPGSQKCCRTSFGKQCVLPDGEPLKSLHCGIKFNRHLWRDKHHHDTIVTKTTRFFSGYCPEVSLNPGQATICLAECSDDYSCARALSRQKCCSFGCRRTCMEATEEHPGVCPLRPVMHTFVPCENTCEDDQQCPLSQKCCFTGCSRGCLDSVRSEQCRLPPETGPCKAAHLHYYYSPDVKRCLEFIYAGCQGNSNNFETKEECEKTCGPVNPAKHSLQ